MPRISDRAAYEANIVAIDNVAKTQKYYHIIAWAKWLGFIPETARKILEEAQLDDAPPDALQKVDGRWLCLGDINNESNRNRVDNLAKESRSDRTQ